jgi:hypothetical protein
VSDWGREYPKASRVFPDWPRLFPKPFTDVGGGIIPSPHVWSVLDLTGLNRWYDPSDGATVTLVGSTVSQLNDKSGNDFHLTQTTSSRRPTMRDEGGRNALEFTGVSDLHLISTTGVGSFSGSDVPFAFFAIVRCDDGPPSHEGRFAGLTSSTDGDPLSLFGLTAAAVGWVHIRRDDTRAFTKTAAASITANTSLNLVSYLFNGTQTTIRVNGVDTIVNGDTNTNALTINQFAIGAFVGGGNIFTDWDGAVGENILTTVVPDASVINSVEAYLADRWGISI